MASLFFCIIMVGSFFFLFFILLYRRGNKLAKRAFEFSFIAIFGIACVANIVELMEPRLSEPPENSINAGVMVWVSLWLFVIWSVYRCSKRVKTICMTLCFLASPIVPLFALQAFGYNSFISNRGTLPTLSESGDEQLKTRGNVYIFIFDEWSYQRSFSDKELIPEFRNLKQFTDRALVFHNARSRWDYTERALPALLFQNDLQFIIKKNQLGFQGKQFYPIEDVESIFHHARELGYYTAMVGHAMPYGEMLGESVDFCRAICAYKWFGDDFFDVVKIHLLSAGLLLPTPFFHSERVLLSHYFFNRFQVELINTTHDLFKTIVHNSSRPTVTFFHYNIPHFPHVFTRNGHKEFFAVYKTDESENYYGNLAYLDEKIGEIISNLKASKNYDNSLIIMTSDHSWRFDPDYDRREWQWIFEKLHVPLCIKLPGQTHSIEIDSKFLTFKLGSFINNYLDGTFTLTEVKSLLEQEDYFTPTPLENLRPDMLSRMENRG